jgi:protoheme IX farnesyltransferase
MLPVVAGAATTRRHILGYSLLLAAISLLPSLLGTAGWLYLATAALLSAGFVLGAWRLVRTASDRQAMRLFKFSIVYLFGLFLALVLDHVAQPWLSA